MKFLLLILVIGVPFIIYWSIDKFQQKQATEAFDQKIKDINIEEYSTQEEQEKDEKLNQLQKDIFFTKDYIKNLQSKEQLRILKSSELIRAYHYVYSKMPSAISPYKRYKFIVLEFTDDLLFFIADNNNKEKLSEQPKHNEVFNFDNQILDLLKEKYPHIQIGFETNNNDIRVFTTRNKAATPISGLYDRNKQKESYVQTIETFEKVTEKEKNETIKSLKTSNKKEQKFEPNIEINFCSHCGAKLPPDANFCGKCGTQIRRTNE